jgi:phosphoribosyl 1,2-cyclic phosphodiesterase
LLKKIVSPRLKHVVLAHLSEQNNDPALARLASADAISQTGHATALHVASQNEPMALKIDNCEK